MTGRDNGLSRELGQEPLEVGVQPAAAIVAAPHGSGKEEVARNQQRHAITGLSRSDDVAVMGLCMTGCFAHGNLERAEGQGGALDGRGRSVDARPRGSEDRNPTEISQQAGETADVLGFPVGHKDRVQRPDCRRPGPPQGLTVVSGIKENAMGTAAVGNDVRIGHPDAMGHAQRVEAEGQSADFGQWIPARCEGDQTFRAQSKCARQTSEFLRSEIVAVVDGIAQTSEFEAGLTGDVGLTQISLAQCLLQHVAQLVLQGCAFDDHGASMGHCSRIAKKFWFSGGSRFAPGMQSTQTEVLEIFTRTKALLQGHFVLRSGLHSAHYFQCAQVCQHMDAVTRLAELLLQKLSHLTYTTVLAPAMGGLVVGQEVARQAGARYIFAEKENNVLVLRRGFKLAPGEPVLIVEDVVTRGGRVLECIEIVKQAGGTPVGVAMLVDRSAGTARFEIPAISLMELSFPTYAADAVPDWLAAIPVDKPGS